MHQRPLRLILAGTDAGMVAHGLVLEEVAPTDIVAFAGDPRTPGRAGPPLIRVLDGRLVPGSSPASRDPHGAAHAQA